MPLLGKIVVIKRNGEDGTEFPLTAACMFGRKLDCDIRIQLPQVSKEHCRIELNENKELILTNLSSVNPTRINGEILQQSERLKDGDLITIIDRSFRFQYPPPPTPKKKRLSTPRKSETVKVLQDQQVRSTPASTEKKTEHLSDTCLKDGSNLPTPDQSAGDAKTNTENTSSPFSDLYNMVKRDLALKPQWKSATPTSKLPVNKEEPKVPASGTENEHPVTPQSTKKTRRSSTAKFVNGSDVIELSDRVGNHPAEVVAFPAVQNVTEKQKRRSQSLGIPVSQKKTPQTTPQKFTAQEVAQQIALVSPSTKQTPTSPKSPRRSSASQILAVTPKEQTTPKNPSEPSENEEVQVKQASRTSPRANAGKRFQVQDVLNEIVSTTDADHNVDGQSSSKKHKLRDLPIPAAKRKRVSFGGQLSPELFDKRLPPDSPLRRGATPGRRSLSFFQKPQSLLRRASTIGLSGFSLEEAVSESPVKSTSKTPSPAKKSSGSKAKTPSPKTHKTSPKTPAASSRSASPKTPVSTSRSASPKTPVSSSRSASPKTPAASSRSASPKTPVSTSRSASPKTPLSTSRSASPKTPVSTSRSASPKTPVSTSMLASPKTPKSATQVSINSSLNTTSASGASLLMTPTTHGRFSVSIISTPSPVSSLEKVVEEESVPVVEEPQKYVTPKISAKRRSSLRASSRKTPLSSLKNMVRSRRSGASLANLKVVSSWADIVKFGQAKAQMEGAKKTSTKQKAAKQTKVMKPKTPARRLVNHTSTGHADSPATIVVGKAFLRSTNPVGAAPKVVCNLALRKKDLKMDEDLTGVADIFKTPANTRRKSAFKKNMETPVGEKASTEEMSVMMTPEESGEMMVSPLSVASTAKCRGFNTDAVSRLLQDDKNGSLIEEMETSDCPALETSIYSSDAEQEPVKTPKRQPEPSECLTGVKRLMRTPKQKAEPIEDLRGKLLKTPKEPKKVQESLEGLKELFKTPKQKVTPVEDMAGLKELMTTPVVKDDPDVTQRRSARTPKDKTVHEDLTGVKQLMKTPKVKGAPVEQSFGIKRLLKTPKEKHEPVEDLTGIQQMMKTPNQKVQPTKLHLTGVKQMMKTPNQKVQPTKVHLTGVKQMMKTPKQKEQLAEVDLIGVRETMETPKQKEQPAKVDLAVMEVKTPRQKVPAEVDHTDPQQITTPKQKVKSSEVHLTDIKHIMKTPKQKSQPLEDLLGVKRLLSTPKQKQQPVENDFEISQLMDSQKLAEEPASKPSSVIENKSVEVHELSSTDKPAVATDADEAPEDQENICLDKHIVTEAATRVQNISQVIVDDAETKTNQDVEEVTSDDAGHVKNTQETQVESGSLKSTFGETVFHAVESSQVSAAGKGKRDQVIANLIEDIPTQSPARKSTRGKTSKIEEKPALNPRRGARYEDVQMVLNIEESMVSEPPTLLKSAAASKAKRGRKAEQVSENQSISMVPEEPEVVPDKPAVVPETPVESNTRARRGRAANKDTRKIVQTEDPKPASVNHLQLSEAVVNEHELKASAEIEVPVKSNTRSRGKVTKKSPNTEQAKDSSSKLTMSDSLTVSVSEMIPEAVEDALQVSAEPQPAETEAPVKANARSRRGKVAKKGISKAALVEAPEPTTASEEPDKSSEAVVIAVPENEAPVKTNTRSRRGKPAKTQIEDLAEVVSVNEEAETKTLAPPVRSIAKSKRGKANTKESQVEQLEETIPAGKDTKMPKVEAQPVSAAPQASEAECAVGSNSRSRRGRAIQKEAVKTDQVEKTMEATPVITEPENNGDVLMVKSGRGRRAKLASSKDLEIVERKVDEPHAECLTAATDAAEPVVEPVVKNVRGGRRANQTKTQVSEKAQDKVVLDQVECPDAPVVKATRGKRTVTVVVEPEVPVKRGRRGTAPEVPPPVIKPSRGRRAAVKPELKEVQDDIKEADQASESVIETDLPSADADRHDNPINKVVAAKRGRGRAAKASNKDVSINEAEEPAASVSKKAVNWNADLVTWKNIEEFKSPAKEEPPAKGRKGKVPKKQEEPEKPTAGTRGRTGASVVSNPSEAIVPKRGQKRKEVVVAPEVVESVAKRRRGTVAGSEETSQVVEEEETKPASNEKPARGKRKASQETSAVQTQAEDPVQEVTTRRGTRAQKSEVVVTTAAPVRRTRRK